MEDIELIGRSSCYLLSVFQLCWIACVCTGNLLKYHRLVGVGRGASRDLWVWPANKAGSLQQVTQVGVQAALEYLQRRTHHNLSVQPVPVLHHSDSKEVLPCVSMELPVFQFMPIAALLDSTEKSPPPHQLDTCILDSYKHLLDPLSAFSFQTGGSGLSALSRPFSF